MSEPLPHSDLDDRVMYLEATIADMQRQMDHLMTINADLCTKYVMSQLQLL
jgi:hypothetical protein